MTVLINEYYSGDQIKKEMGGVCSKCGTGRVPIGLWWGDLMERCHLEDIGVDGRGTLKWIFKKLNDEPWTGLIWVRIGTGSRLF